MFDLEEILAPFPVDAFHEKYAGRLPLHVAGGDGSRRRLLSWGEFNHLLEQQGIWTAETLRLVQDRSAVHPDEYCRPQVTPAGVIRRPSPQHVQLHIARGASVVANEVQTLHGPIARWAAALSRAFAAQVGANVYCSFRDVQAFGPHFDAHDVFAVQTEGEKRWRIYEGQIDMPVDLPPDSPETRRWLENSHGPLLTEVVMRPGDLLYLPRGRFHEALAIDDASLHVTFSVTPLYGRVLFSLLENAAMQFPEFRRYFPPADQGEGRPLRAHLAELGQLLAELTMSPAFLSEIAMAQERLIPQPVQFNLPVRPQLKRYEVTAPEWKSAARDAQIVAEWCIARRTFAFEELIAEIDFIPPDRLRAIIDEQVTAGTVRKAEQA